MFVTLRRGNKVRRREEMSVKESNGDQVSYEPKAGKQYQKRLVGVYIVSRAWAFSTPFYLQEINQKSSSFSKWTRVESYFPKKAGGL
jgi:hypothetical protein